ncbi:arrestin domain-containing protein 3-like isoform X5 [Eriocheir sinensis]|uniref:arrestin domain-containing protein 3-like isoform X5 n=1 Tax=Eriocheir sinensis TaxID=95602 RepID=UPI0021C626B7|nr:arrestin domain-containing protein 3-like isoform X5 [Eriocheir sinensis]XP_050735693.1 arrestin domain-containing protein 3-like isoform X5 [Eriocheir sinensis]XP_050735694.1 arrestin domain-containing protein 3-like isoform X5 [Eriocheir sinensis]
MPTSIAVVFDNPSAVYFTGQTITGYVQAICDKPKKCRGIEVEFKGYAKVHWTERTTTGTGDDRKTETRHYTSQEKYYEMNYWVWGNGSDSYELPPGQHVFRFNFLVPNGIPSSFESHVGKVRHQCKAKMDIPWKTDKTCTRPYSINTLLDLNTNPQAPMPISFTEEKYACCLWCRSGPMTVALRIDRSGFVPGEKMIINAECINTTRNEINHTKVTIEQITTYYAEGRTKKERRKVAEIKRGVIEPGKEDIWSAVEMTIPPLPPSNLEYCRIIDIDYEFQFEMEPSGCHTDLDFAVPVIIGSIPLQQYFSSFAPAVPPPAYPSPGAPGYPAAGAPGYPAPGAPEYPAPGAPGYPAPGAPGYPAPGAPEYPAPGAPGYPAPGAPGYPPPPGYPELPAYNPNAPPAVGFAAGGVVPNSPPQNSAFMPPPYPGSPAPSAPPTFPGIQQYPGMPLPEYNPCMFGMTKFSEHDSDDEDQEHGFAPFYVSYALLGSRRPPAAGMENAPGLLGAPSPEYCNGSDTAVLVQHDMSAT